MIPHNFRQTKYRKSYTCMILPVNHTKPKLDTCKILHQDGDGVTNGTMRQDMWESCVTPPWPPPPPMCTIWCVDVRDDYQKTRVNTGMSVYACSHYLFKRQPVFALFRVIFALFALYLAAIQESSNTCVLAPTAGEHHSSCPWRWCDHARVQFLVMHTRERFSLVLAPTAGEHPSSYPCLWCTHARARFLVNQPGV